VPTVSITELKLTVTFVTQLTITTMVSHRIDQQPTLQSFRLWPCSRLPIILCDLRGQIVILSDQNNPTKPNDSVIETWETPSNYAAPTSSIKVMPWGKIQHHDEPELLLSQSRQLTLELLPERNPQSVCYVTRTSFRLTQMCHLHHVSAVPLHFD